MTRSRPWPRSPLVAQSLYAFDFLAQAIRTIRRLSPDVVHTQNFPHAAIRQGPPQAAIVLHMHCDWLAELDRHAMNRALAPAISQSVLRTCRDGGARALLKWAQFSQSCRMERPREPGRRRSAKYQEKYCCWPCVARKGIHTLIKAWQTVIAACPEGPPRDRRPHRQRFLVSS